jgi:curved DNA-binding protein CbpA
METRDKGFKGSLAATALPQVLRQIFLEGLKGTLRLVRRDEVRNLFFEKGELRTATSSREGQKIGAFLKRRGWITDKDLAWALETVARQGRARLGKILVDRGLVSRAVLDAEMRRLVEEIVFSTFEWNQGDYHFEPSPGVLDPDVVLALSTAAIVVEGIRRLPESDAFRQRLGDGKRIPILAGDPLSRYQYLPLTPQEAYLLSRVDGLLDLDALLKLGGASRAAAAKTLYALVSCGIVEWKGEGSVLATSVGPEHLNVEVSAQPAVLSPGYAEMVRSTYRRIDWLTHYELLGVDPKATLQQIRMAYFERSRAFHPDLRHRPELADCQKELEKVFARLRAAFEVLSDSRERANYDASVNAPAGLAFDAASDPNARVEMAARSFSRARQLIEAKDFHPAVQMLREAIRFVPDNAEYRFCLAQVELQNAKWVEKGLENLMEAARLEPKKLQYLREAARELLAHGRAEEALLFAKRAVQVDPSAANQQLLAQVTGTAEPEKSASGGAGAAAPPLAPPGPDSLPAPARRFGFLTRLFRHRA